MKVREIDDSDNSDCRIKKGEGGSWYILQQSMESEVCSV